MGDFIIFRYCGSTRNPLLLHPIFETTDRKMKRLIGMMAFVSMVLTTHAQVHAADSVMQHVKGNKLSVGGYGEVAYSRNYYSDHVSRYSQPEEHKNDPSHGHFDIPHAVIYLGYDFGKGWSLGTEIEFEHGGAGLAYEK